MKRRWERIGKYSSPVSHWANYLTFLGRTFLISELSHGSLNYTHSANTYTFHLLCSRHKPFMKFINFIIGHKIKIDSKKWWWFLTQFIKWHSAWQIIVSISNFKIYSLGLTRSWKWFIAKISNSKVPCLAIHQSSLFPFSSSSFLW